MSSLTLRKANIVNNCVMENNEQQILSEIRQMISYMRSQLDLIEEKVEQLVSDNDREAADELPVDLDIEDVMMDFEVAETVDQEVAGPEVSEEFTIDEAEEAEEIVALEEKEASDVGEDGLDVEAEVEEEVEAESEIKAEDVLDEPSDDDVLMTPAEESVDECLLVMPEDPEDDLPEGDMLIDVAAAALKPAVIDAMTEKEAWRRDIPGSAVKDIRGAISLNDRILFINSLFDEDPMLFQTVLTKINSMTSLDEAVEYLRTERPSWNMESDEVYRFMMAVRRRIQ